MHRGEGSDHPTLPPPPCIDDFDVGQELGRGGFAVVYRARVRASGREVALKVVDKSRACEKLGDNSHGDGAELACARVANEVRLHWGLKHPAVVELFDFFEDDRFVYLVLELCGGGDLYRRLKKGGPLGEREAAGYMGQLLAGLAYLHERGVMHRDLKLANMLLSEDGRRLRIADFGLAAKLEDEDQETHTICGTPNYMAPEVQGHGYGLSADLWSAGCLFYTMVTGKAPFRGPNVGDTLAKARAGRYVEPKGLSAMAKDFLSSMLSLDPNRRMRVDEAASHPFLRLDNHLPSPGVDPKLPVKSMKLEPSLSASDVAGSLVKDLEAEAAVSLSGKRESRSRGKAASAARSKLGVKYLASSALKNDVGGGGTAAGHSMLTASTAIIGSDDRYSVNSSVLMGGGHEVDSFTTLRAEAVPTPAKMGKDAVAAAARVRRSASNAAVRAPLPRAMGNVSGRNEKKIGGENKIGCRRDPMEDAVVKRSPQGRRREGYDEAFGEGREGDSGCGAGLHADHESGVRRSGREERGSERRSTRGGSAFVSAVPDGTDGSSALSERTPEGRDGFLGDVDECLHGGTDSARASSCHSGDRRDRFHDGGNAKDIRQASNQVDEDQQRIQRRSRRHRSRPTQQQAVEGKIAGVVSSRQRRIDVERRGGYSSDDSLPPRSENADRVSRRRRRRNGSSAVASRPPPPLPPQPPPTPPGGERAHPIRRRDLRELRATAEAQRRLHEPECLPTSTRTDPTTKDLDILVPLSTGRIKPVFHSLGGKAAIEVYNNGRASIAVGKRWLVTSPNGERVWTGSVGAGVSSSSYTSASVISSERRRRGGDALGPVTASAAAAAETARAEIVHHGHTLRTLPNVFWPLYRSLAGIVDGLRSKTPKLALSWERVDAGAESPLLEWRPERSLECATEVVVCALMDNLPEPDFVATFGDGASLSVSNRKNELRVELPSGGVHRWSMGPGREWPECSGGTVGAYERNGETSRSVPVEDYLRTGLDGYCRCLREEIEAYEHRENFPLEIVVANKMAYSGGGRMKKVSENAGGVSVSKAAARPPSGSGRDGGSSVPRARREDRAVEEDAGAVYHRRRRSDHSVIKRTVAGEEDPQYRHAVRRDDRGVDGPERRSALGVAEHDRNRCSNASDVSSGRPPHAVSSREGPCAPRNRSTPSERRVNSVPVSDGARASPLRATADGARHSSRHGGRRHGGRVVATVEKAQQHYGTDKLKEAPLSQTSSLTCSPTTSEDHRSRGPERVATAPRGSADGGVGRREDRKSDRPAQRGTIAVIPGLGEAFRDERGNLEVRFDDGVMVTVDAKAKWMCVEQLAFQGRDSRCNADRGVDAEGEPPGPVTYDLGSRSARTSKSGSGGDGRGSRQRMPRDVKDRMKALPRFINALRRASSSNARGREEGTVVTGEEEKTARGAYGYSSGPSQATGGR